MKKFNSRALGMSWLLATLVCASIGCSSIPQPCDPVFTTATQQAMAVSCRSKAETTCPGYSDMPEDKKLECPGVLECLEKIEKVETDCHGS